MRRARNTALWIDPASHTRRGAAGVVVILVVVVLALVAAYFMGWMRFNVPEREQAAADVARLGEKIEDSAERARPAVRQAVENLNELGKRIPDIDLNRVRENFRELERIGEADSKAIEALNRAKEDLVHMRDTVSERARPWLNETERQLEDLRDQVQRGVPQARERIQALGAQMREKWEEMEPEVRSRVEDLKAEAAARDDATTSPADSAPDAPLAETPPLEAERP